MKLFHEEQVSIYFQPHLAITTHQHDLAYMDPLTYLLLIPAD
jgi:hypothetical protein